MNIKIGSTLCLLRKNNNYTQRELAKRLGVKPATIGHWEQDRNEPSFAMLRKITALYNISVSDLFEGSSDEKDFYDKKGDETLLYSLIKLFIDEKLISSNIKSIDSLDPLVKELLTSVINRTIDDINSSKKIKL